LNKSLPSGRRRMFGGAECGRRLSIDKIFPDCAGQP
jgi:hypothetical protein